MKNDGDPIARRMRRENVEYLRIWWSRRRAWLWRWWHSESVMEVEKKGNNRKSLRTK